MKIFLIIIFLLLIPTIIADILSINSGGDGEIIIGDKRIEAFLAQTDEPTHIAGAVSVPAEEKEKISFWREPYFKYPIIFLGITGIILFILIFIVAIGRRKRKKY